MSLAGATSEAVSLYNILVECEKEITNIEKRFGASNASELEDKADRVFISMSQVFMIARRLTNVMRRMGLGEDAESAINTMTQMVTTSMMLYRSLTLLEAATPYGLIMGAMGLFGVAESAQSELERLIPSAH